ncbi:hypothetical protein RHMOL_Rhmol07G0290300 [Rhododendron molle]|uniref:Uncharacterized protein n=1 Tax=Rhododendron molle TaxID=49168 RepID=A0ACC0N708_RHOML|nr:hypothetical protein RHMOL_Rhmol07G0290300 [Rhododendron molle]
MVDWSSLVWHKKQVPMWSFILWVAILGRLSTKGRLRAWGILMDAGCFLCLGGVEDHDYLFFDCSFANMVWMAVKRYCGFGHTSRTLQPELQWGIRKCVDQSMREAYDRQQLIQKHPLVDIRARYSNMMQQGFLDRSRGLYKRPLSAGLEVRLKSICTDDLSDYGHKSEGESESHFLSEYETLEPELQWGIRKCVDQSMRSAIYMLCLAVTIYHLWRERNFRIFQHEGMDTNAATKKVWEEVRACACSWRNLPRSTRKLELCSN